MTGVKGRDPVDGYTEDMRPIKQHLLFACGWTALGVGFVGLAVPVLPTVPFVLLAAACFLRSSQRWHAWLVTHPVFGRHVQDYLAGRGLRPQAKILALATLWASVLLSVFLVVPILAGDVALVAVAAAVSVYLLRLPTATGGVPPREDPSRPTDRPRLTPAKRSARQHRCAPRGDGPARRRYAQLVVALDSKG